MGIKQLVEAIVSQAEQLEKDSQVLYWSSILPAKEGLMLLDGIKYRTGSDYTDNFLNLKLEDTIKIPDTEEYLNDHIRGEVESDRRAEAIEDQQYRWGEERRQDENN